MDNRPVEQRRVQAPGRTQVEIGEGKWSSGNKCTSPRTLKPTSGVVCGGAESDIWAFI